MSDPRWLLTDDERAEQGIGPWTQLDDPAHILLTDGYTSKPKVYKPGCYICEDPEFAQMGLPLCRKCPACGGHIAADDTTCDDCGLDEEELYFTRHYFLLPYEDLAKVDQQSACRGLTIPTPGFKEE